ncbi:MAG: cysteine desulfurase [Candidatus Sungbacteria bacterium]|uniref:Cysteine desulfurase n=1 Tax=Candidatus Sungiibacteriota bacterium TaxID=2750080 RepID=A0A9D6QRN3_9BACT|nr:cysteine desulfurase [Candidatus Sungbacteria bacterium]
MSDNTFKKKDVKRVNFSRPNDGVGVYLDYAGATPMDPEVKHAMEPYFEDKFGNPAALYRDGRLAKDAIDESRKTIARILNCRESEIIFTAGSTEADNIALFGVAEAVAGNRAWGIGNGNGHLIISAIEHHVVLNSAEALKRKGFEVSLAPVDAEGIVNLDELKKLIRSDTFLVSVMYANNEIGTIQPLYEIGKIIKQVREARKASGNNLPIYFHSDGAQAVGACDLDTQKPGLDLFVISGSKIYGPKAIGALYIRRGTPVRPMFFGGGQENNLRSGTENVPAIVGLAKALELAEAKRNPPTGGENTRLIKLRDYFIKRLVTEIPKTILNGHATRRLPNNVNVSILDIEGEAAVLYLDAHSISISTGSACTSLTLDPSHVILALGRPYEHAHSSLRFSLGRKTTKEDIDYVMEVLPQVIARLRQISPLNMKVDQKEISHPEAFAGQGARVKVGGQKYK